MESILPLIELSESERLWLAEVYKLSRSGKTINFKEIWGRLYNELSIGFDPNNVDSSLLDCNGEEIKIMGIIALEGDFSIIYELDKLIVAIKEIILSDPMISEIRVEDISAVVGMSGDDIRFYLLLCNKYGDFFRGASYENVGSQKLKSINVTGNDAVFYSYIKFPGMAKLVSLKSYEAKKNLKLTFSILEQLDMNERLDKLAQDIEILKNGHEIIWTDMKEQFEEMKTLYSLGKLNWRQLFVGKLSEMVAGGVISEVVSKRIVERISPVMKALLQ